jgi:hypothetical protein
MNLPLIRQSLRDIKTMPLTWYPEFFTKGLRWDKYETQAAACLDEAKSTIHLTVFPRHMVYIELTMPYRPPPFELKTMEEADRWVAQQLSMLQCQYEHKMIRNYAVANNFWCFVGWEEKPYEGPIRSRVD